MNSKSLIIGLILLGLAGGLRRGDTPEPDIQPEIAIGIPIREETPKIPPIVNSQIAISSEAFSKINYRLDYYNARGGFFAFGVRINSYPEWVAEMNRMYGHSTPIFNIIASEEWDRMSPEQKRDFQARGDYYAV